MSDVICQKYGRYRIWPLGSVDSISISQELSEETDEYVTYDQSGSEVRRQVRKAIPACEWQTDRGLMFTWPDGELRFFSWHGLRFEYFPEGKE